MVNGKIKTTGVSSASSITFPTAPSLNDNIDITGEDEVGTVSLTQDAVSGALKIMSGDDNVPRAVSRFTPATDDYAGIVAAATICASFGGGIVELGSANIGGNTIPLIDGVVYEGRGFKNRGGTILGATVITGNGTADAFALTSATAIRGAGVRNLAINNVKNGIKLVYTGTGEPHVNCFFENIVVNTAAEWGFWFENFNKSTFHRLEAIGCLEGGLSFMNTGAWNSGNSNMSRLECAAATIQSKTLQFIATSGSLNNIIVTGLTAFTSGTTELNFTCTATASSDVFSMTGGSTTTILRVGMPLQLDSLNLYFVHSIINSTDFKVTQNAYVYGAVNPPYSWPFTTQSKTFYTFGFPNIILQGLQPCTFTGVDVENAPTCQLQVTNCNGVSVDVEFAFKNVVYSSGMQPFSVSCTNVTGTSKINHREAMGVYLDNSSWSTNVPSGRFTNRMGQGFLANNNSALTTSLGVSTGLNGNGMLNLSGYNALGLPDIYINEATRAIGFTRGLLYRQALVTASSTVPNNPASTYSPPIQVFTGATGQTLTLPTIVATGATQNIGLVQEIINSTANAVTIAVSGGTQNIIGDGLKANTFTLAAQTSGRFLACTDGTNPFWAKI